MKNFSFSLLMLLLTAGTLFAQPSGEWTNERLQKMYVTFLEKDGYSPEVDKDGDVQFTHDDLHYFIDVDSNDPSYFAIMLANIWEIESLEERGKILEVCNSISRSDKAVKGQIVGDNVWITCEIFLPEPDDFDQVFNRMMSAIETSIETFKEGVQ